MLGNAVFGNQTLPGVEVTKALTIRGSFRGASGYDHQVREFARALHFQGIRIQLIDFPDWSPHGLSEKLQESWFERFDEPVNSEIVLHFCMPHQVRIVKNLLNVNFTMFEATRTPKKWVKLNRKHDLVIVPTDSSKDAWINSGYSAEKLQLCPLGVNPNVYRLGIEPLSLKDDKGHSIQNYKVRLLNISDVIPRKNLLGLLRVWIRTTMKTDNAILILKINCRSEKWLKKFFRNVKDLEKSLGKTRHDSAAILFLVNHFFSDDEMPRLYAAATHYWSMSHGEGWDLAMMEAAATGLHLIAPKHTAYTSYLDETIADLIPARRVPARFRSFDGAHKLFEGAEWWEPDENSASDFLASAITNNNGKINMQASRKVTQNFTWAKTAERLRIVLNELEEGLENANF